MKAILFPGSGTIRHAELADPEPGPGQVLIRMSMSGICGTDLNYLAESPEQRGERCEIVPGHEACGVIVAVGPGVLRRKVGDRVVGYHHVGCGLCHYCRLGVPTQCPDKQVAGRHFHGSDAQYEVLPEHAALPIPDAVSDIEGAIIACNYSTAYSALMKADLRPLQTVAVFGQGGVGLCATMTAVALGARVAALDLSDDRLQMGRTFGAEITLNPTRDDVVNELRAWGGGRGVDIVLECAGSSQAIDQGLAALGPLGTLMAAGAGSVLNADTLRFRSPEQTIKGTSVYRLYEFEPMIRLLLERRLPLEEIVHTVTTVDHAEDAFETMKQQETGKVLFDWR